MRKFLPIFIKFSYEISEVVVIDNGSTDQSIQLLKSDFKDVKVVALEKNLGFAGGYNKGLKELNHEYFIIVNSDVEVTKNWIPPLLGILKNNPNVVAVQPKILNYNNLPTCNYHESLDQANYTLNKEKLVNSTKFGSTVFHPPCGPDQDLKRIEESIKILKTLG